jgi:hypothetical protein
MEVSGQLHATAALFTEEKSPEPIGQEVGWAAADPDAMMERKNPIIATLGNRTRVCQLVA